MGVQDIMFVLLEVLVGIVQVVYFYLEALYRQFVPPKLQDIAGETVLVTGAAGAIGQEICKYLAKSGNNIKLLLWDLNLDALKKFETELKEINSTVKVYSFGVDISAKENIDAACEEVRKIVSAGPSIIFNNAGVLHYGNFLQLTEKQIRMTIEINLMSHFWIIRHFLGDMVKNDFGRIVNTCSIAGLLATTHSVPYFASKFAVNGMTEALKSELDQFRYKNIHVTTLYPYFVQTPMIQTLVLKKGKGLFGPFSKPLLPAEVAKKAVNGMRRQLEYVYCPPAIPLLVFFQFLIPNKVRKIVNDIMMGSMEYKDKAANKRLHEPYLETMKNQQIK